MQIEDFDYALPPTAIAQMPAEPRDSSRLLVAGAPPVDTEFSELPAYLREGDLLVVNATRVRAARLRGIRPTGGAVELLLLDRSGDEWEALGKPARKLRAGMVLSFGELSAEVRRVGTDGRVWVSLATESGAGVEETIDRVGSVPYPPYVADGPVDPERYQTVYAASTGSAAAPTAGLHFTRGMLESLAARGIHTSEVFLEIGLDTFRPIVTDNLDEHRMHSERFHIPNGTAAAIEATRHRGGRVVAVGTTVVRALESNAVDGGVQPGSGSTDLFIRPGYRPQVVGALLTNLHMPRSSLVVMIAAFLPEWRELYQHALDSGYRFLSFGDAMFIPEIP